MEEYNQGKYFLTPFSSLLSKLRECLKSKHYIFIAEHKQLRLQKLWKLRLFMKFPQKGSMVFRKMVEATYLDIRSHRCTFVYFLVVTKRWWQQWTWSVVCTHISRSLGGQRRGAGVNFFMDTVLLCWQGRVTLQAASQCPATLDIVINSTPAAAAPAHANLSHIK